MDHGRKTGTGGIEEVETTELHVKQNGYPSSSKIGIWCAMDEAFGICYGAGYVYKATNFYYRSCKAREIEIN